MFFIYSITCVPTCQVYIGQTTKNPFLRWARHFSELKRGVHSNKFLQKAWNEYSCLSQWSCAVLEHTISKREANIKEARHVYNTPDDFRMNAMNGLMAAMEKRDEVIDMLKEGIKYTTIRDNVGISLGTISKIAQEFKQVYF